MHVYRNIEARSRNHYCSGKARNITYSERVFVVFFIQHANSMRRVVLSSMVSSAVQNFSTFPHKRH